MPGKGVSVPRSGWCGVRCRVLVATVLVGHAVGWRPAAWADLPGSFWVIERIEGPRGFPAGIPMDLALDAAELPHAFYAGDQLYYARRDGNGLWTIEAVDGDGCEVSCVSGAVDSGGAAHVAYWLAGTRELRYGRRDAESWTLQTVPAAGDVGPFVAVVLDDADDLHMVFHDPGEGDLVYARSAPDAWSFETIDAAGHVGEYCSLAWHPSEGLHAGYYDRTHRWLKHAWRTEGGWLHEVVDASIESGRFSSIAIAADGAIHISYQRTSADDMQLCHAVSTSDGWAISIVRTDYGTGRHTRIAVDPEGVPHITFTDAWQSRPGHTSARAWGGGEDWHIDWGTRIESYDDSPMPLVCDDEGYLHYLYYDGQNRLLTYEYQDDEWWHRERFDVDEDIGQGTSVAMGRDGEPIVAFVNGWEMLRYGRRVGGRWQIDTLLRSGGYANPSVALAVDACNVPHVVRLLPAGRDSQLLYLRRTSAGWQSEPVAWIGDGLAPVGLAIDSEGNPHASFAVGGGYGQLAYARRTEKTFETEVIDPDYGAGREGNAIVVDADGTPHVGYHLSIRNGYGDLRYARRSGGVWRIEVIETQGSSGSHTSIALDPDRRPWVSYRSRTEGALKCAHRNLDFWETEVVDAGGDVGLYSSIGIDEAGGVHVAYHDAVNGFLKYALRSERGWDVEVVDDSGQAGAYASLALDAFGSPHVTYHDSGADEIRYAYRVAAGAAGARITQFARDAPGRFRIGWASRPGAASILRARSPGAAVWRVLAPNPPEGSSAWGFPVPEDGSCMYRVRFE